MSARSATTPKLNFDLGDLFYYDRTANEFNFSIGSTVQFSLNATTADFKDNDVTTSGAVTGSNLNIANWNTAFGWGNHASGGYLTNQALVDNSIADTLHRHSELVAPDGSPDPAVSVDAAGDATLTGNLAIGTAGKGIDFDPAGSGAAANLFDDYEEGEWTPTIQDASLSAAEGQGYNIQQGSYTKTGNLVTIRGRAALNSLGTMTGGNNAVIAGLPFTHGGTAPGGLSVTFAVSLSVAAGSNIAGYITGATAKLRIWDSTAGTSNLLISEITASGDIMFFGQYEA